MSADGRDDACRDADRVRARLWRAANPEKVRARNRKYYAANAAEIQLRRKERKGRVA